MFRRCGYANLQNILRSAGAEHLFFLFSVVPHPLNEFFSLWQLFARGRTMIFLCFIGIL